MILIIKAEEVALTPVVSYPVGHPVDLSHISFVFFRVAGFDTEGHSYICVIFLCNAFRTSNIHFTVFLHVYSMEKRKKIVTWVRNRSANISVRWRVIRLAISLVNCHLEFS